MKSHADDSNEAASVATGQDQKGPMRSVRRAEESLRGALCSLCSFAAPWDAYAGRQVAAEAWWPGSSTAGEGTETQTPESLTSGDPSLITASVESCQPMTDISGEYGPGQGRGHPPALEYRLPGEFEVLTNAVGL